MPEPVAGQLQPQGQDLVLLDRAQVVIAEEMPNSHPAST